MIPRGNSPQVRVGKEPEQRTQQKSTQTNKIKATTEKEDAQDSATTRQHACVTAEKEDATDSTAHKAGTRLITTTNMSTKENEADSLAKPLVSDREEHKALEEETSKTNTTTSVTWSTTTTENNYEVTSNKFSAQWKIPNQIGITKRDTELTNVFRFVGEEGKKCERPEQELRTTLLQAGDQIPHGTYMDASQDYSFARRRIVKPSRKWKTNTIKTEQVRPLSDTRQNTPASKTVNTTNKGQTQAPKLFRFGKVAEVTKKTGTPPRSLQEFPRRQNCPHDRKNSRRVQKSKPTTTEIQEGPDNKSNPAVKRRGTAPKPRKTDQYEQRIRELKTVMEMRAQRRAVLWKERQQKKLQGNTEPLNVSALLQMKLQKNIKTRRRRTNTKRPSPKKSKKTPAFVASTPEANVPITPYIEKRQQTSSAVRFARFRSNRRYKPGD